MTERVDCMHIFCRFEKNVAGGKRNPGSSRLTGRRYVAGSTGEGPDRPGRPSAGGRSTLRVGPSGSVDGGFGPGRGGGARRARLGSVWAVVGGGRGLRAVLVGVTLRALGLLPAGCGFEDPGQVTLGYLTWDENIAVSNLTKVLLEGDLGYENVELRRAEDVVPAYKMVGSAEADAFQDTWMPNQREALSKVEDEVELLDPWFKGTTRFSVATPAYMNISSLEIGR